MGMQIRHDVCPNVHVVIPGARRLDRSWAGASSRRDYFTPTRSQQFRGSHAVLASRFQQVRRRPAAKINQQVWKK